MQVAAVLGKGMAGLVERPDPQPKGSVVVVRVLSAPMCTEYTAFREGAVGHAHGHEAAGEVVAVDQPGKVGVGDRVVVMPQYPCGECALCRSGDYIHCEHNLDVPALMGDSAATATMAQYLVKQDWLLLPVPKGMSLDHASMACCGLGPTYGALRLMDAQPGETVLIVGLGPVGLGGVINALDRGCEVIAVDLEPYRLRLAETLGAKATLRADETDLLGRIRELTGGLGADKTIRCTPAPGTQLLAMEATRRKGQVAFVGWGGDVPVNTLLSKGLTLHGAWHYNLADAGGLMQVIRRNGDQLDRLITHTFPLHRIQDAWELQLTGQCGKVVLHPWE
jgi:L-iditol 2-dehydrogenase